MWPFSKKPKPPEPVPLRDGLERLSAIGIRTRPGITSDDLLFSLGGTFDSPVDPVDLLCVLGGDVERGDFSRISDDIWHFDAECIVEEGDYVRLAERFASLAKGALPIEQVKDHVDVEGGEAWIEFVLNGENIRWELTVDNDWVDPEFYSNFQALTARGKSDKKFFISALGQDSLISFGDAQMKEQLARFSGLQFAWE